jgi:hypothetical protein
MNPGKGIFMHTLKDEIADLIHNLPEDSSLEDIQYHLYVLEKIRKGQKSIKDGKGISNDEARTRLSKWITE